MRKLGLFAFALGAACLGLPGACGGGSSSGNPDGAPDGTCGPFCNPFADAASEAQACTNLCLKQVSCPPGADGGPVTTTVSGTVYDPADKVPLYDVAVYVPNAPLSPLTHGATCDQCGSTLSGDPLVATLTDAAGHFSLANVPVDSSVPLVIQVGKWRRHITIPSVTACVDNPITDKTQTSLPTKPQELNPDDDIPYIAQTTGGADALECLLPKIGIDPGQFVNKGTAGRVNIYQGSGGSALSGGSPSVTTFWNDHNNLIAYDMVIMGCEGGTHPENKGNGTDLPQMEIYANAGGRVFGTHYHYYWIESQPAPSLWPTTATFDHAQDPPQNNWPVLIDQTFPKGQAFAQWMLNVAASTTLGTFDIDEGRHDVDAVNGQPPTDPVSTRWVYGTSPSMVEYYTFNTPIFSGGVPDGGTQCGKVVFSDLHVAAGDTPGGTFPGNCTNQPLTPQEKALEFLLFDLSSCIQNDSEPPPPPVN
jgi:hypothetical protein